MRALIVGGGGREHALAWGLSRSTSVDKLFAVPFNNNPGLRELAECEPSIAISEHGAIADYALSKKIDLVVVGPEVPLVEGLADVLRARGLRVFGPSAAAARIEGSKAWAKDIMIRAGIPTASSATFDAVEPALEYLRSFGAPCVVKADGLAGGKGVRMCETLEEAAGAVRDCLQHNVFGAAGARVVIEEMLAGEEVSVFCLSDGRNVLPLVAAQDHKRLLDGDHGPNTGGMGAYSPVPHIDVVDRVVAETFEPLVAAMARDGTPFTGVLFGGFMVTSDGPKVLEFNCRFGDPETQAIIPRLESDLGELLFEAADGSLDGIKTQWSPRAAVCVVLAGGGYPERSDSGTPIEGLDAAATLEDVIVFHAGTAPAGGNTVTRGGRVLGVTGMGDTLEAARDRAYRGANEITFDGKQMRSDIAVRATKERT